MKEKMREKNEKLSMEKYLEFLYSHKQSDLKNEFLNQIISLHGFKRLKFPKSALIEAVSAIELMNPSRSTLKENIAPGASVALNGVMEDLNDLTWQECCVTSIRVLNSRQAEVGKENLHRNHIKNRVSKSSRDVDAAVSASAAASTSPLYADELEAAGDKKPKKRLKKLALTSSFYAAGAEVGEQKKKSVPRRKRSARAGIKSPFASSTEM